MKKEEIHFGDIKRFLFGQTPPEFMIEVFIRTILIYLILLLVFKLLGKRMIGQMTHNELAVMLTLGAIVSPVMQLPDRGLMFGVVVLFFAVLFQRGINLLEVKNPDFEKLSQGQMVLLVRDGIVNVRELEKANISKQKLFTMLRVKGVQNLGKVDRAYLEACGIFTVYETSDAKVGLPILPPADHDILAIEHSLDGNTRACCNCGHVQQVAKKNAVCEVCHSCEWTTAYEVA